MIKNIITFVILYAVHAANSMAEDIEIYQNSDYGVRPNIMFLLDTSKSMEETEIFATGEYDATIRYPGPFHNDRYYFKDPSIFNSLANDFLDIDADALYENLIDNHFPKEAFKCQDPDILDAINTQGAVTSEFLQWDPTQAFHTGKLKINFFLLLPIGVEFDASTSVNRQGVWKEIKQTGDFETGRYVDCRRDLANPDGLIAGDGLYMTNEANGVAYTSNSSLQVGTTFLHKDANNIFSATTSALVEFLNIFTANATYFTGAGYETLSLTDNYELWKPGGLGGLLTGLLGAVDTTGAIEPSNKLIFDGNYLNYDYYTTNYATNKVTRAPRMYIMGAAIGDAVANNPGLNVGLSRFDGTMYGNNLGLFNINVAARGGMIRVPMLHSEEEASAGQYSTAKKFEKTVKDWDPWGWTPMSESYYEVTRYMKGEAPVFGETTKARVLDGGIFQNLVIDLPSVAESGVGNNISNGYQSPITESCQGNHIIIFTDGLPTLDIDANNDIESLIEDMTLPSSLSHECSTQGGSQYNGYNNLIEETVDIIGALISGVLGLIGIDIQIGNGLTDKGHGECADELAYYLANEDQMDDSLLSDYDNTKPESMQNITTHTIAGFLGMGENAEPDEAVEYTKSILRSMAKHGEGGYYEVSSYEGMKNAFNGILGSLLENPSSLSPPSVSVSSYNSLGLSDELYYSVFKPKNNYQWEGNVKRYRLGLDDDLLPTIFDQKNKNAIDDDTGFFADDAQSYWTLDSEGPDGKVVSSGGMANRLTTPRNVFTSQSGSLVPFITDAGDYNVSKTELNIPDENDIYRKNLVAWANGYDVTKPEEDGSFATPRTSMEDPLHSTPITILYSSSNDNVEKALFIGTNSGYLHAFNIDENTPEEYFSFVPKELLQNLDIYYSGRMPYEDVEKAYGIDGPLTYWHQDFNGNGQVDEDEGEQVFLYITLRRGGQSLYALNVTDPDSPELLWEKHGTYPEDIPNKPTVSTGYSNLGQTWAQLEPATVMWDNEQRVVLFTAGGYDPEEDDNFFNEDNSVNAERVTHTKGTTIYMIDALTGEALWDANEHANMAIGTEMTSSFAANVAPIDSTGDGLANIIYAADVGGRIWRFDINQPAIQYTNTDINTTSAGFANGGIIADVYSDEEDGSGNRRFFNEVDVIYQQTNNGTSDSALLSVGSGMRPYPLSDTVTNNYQFVFKDTIDAPTSVNEYNKIEFDDLIEFDPSAEAADNISNYGWAIPLTYTGEKILSRSNTFSNTLLFSTFAPNDVSITSVNCNADPGRTLLYLISIRDGNLSSSTTVSLAQGGIPASPAILEVPTEADENGNTYRRARNVIVGTEVVKQIDSESGTSSALEVGSRYDSVNKDYWFETTDPGINTESEGNDDNE